MPEQPFKDEDVVWRGRDTKYPSDPNEYIYVRDEFFSSGVAIFRLDEWGHYHRQDCDGFHIGMLLRLLLESQKQAKQWEKLANELNNRLPQTPTIIKEAPHA